MSTLIWPFSYSASATDLWLWQLHSFSSPVSFCSSSQFSAFLQSYGKVPHWCSLWVECILKYYLSVPFGIIICWSKWVFSHFSFWVFLNQKISLSVTAECNRYRVCKKWNPHDFSTFMIFFLTEFLQVLFSFPLSCIRCERLPKVSYFKNMYSSIYLQKW